MSEKPLKRFRFMGLLEGSSLLILLFLAMPLKYFFGIPEAVRVVCSIHGFLFVSYCLMIAYMTFIVKWPFVYSVIAVIVAFIPFGNIIFDRKLDKLETV
jgi:integral membrane protein